MRVTSVGIVARCSFGASNGFVRRGDLQKCRITNLGEEKQGRDTRLVVQQPLKRSGRPLYKDISEDAFDAAKDDEISLEDMQFWFSEDWDEEDQGTQYLQTPEQIANKDFSVRNAAFGRAPLAVLEEGQTITTSVHTMHLLHGAVVDIGNEWDGLIPVSEAQWPEVQKVLDLDTEVVVRIHKIRDPDVFRFPVQLELLEPNLGNLITSPDEWRCPLYVTDVNKFEKYMAEGYPDYVPATLKEVEVLGNEGMDDIAFEELYGPMAERPVVYGETEDGEMMLDYETWRAVEILSE